MQTQAPLSLLPLELLKSFARQSVTEQDLKEIKILLSQFFAKKAAIEAQKVMNEKSWLTDDINAIAEQHHRT
jgi:hypothetical protein